MPDATLDFDGVVLRCINVTVNKSHACNSCMDTGICASKQALMRAPGPGNIVYTELQVELENITSKPRDFYSSRFVLVDSTGVQHNFGGGGGGSGSGCSELLVARGFSSDLHLAPRAKVRTLLVFPELPPNVSVDTLYYRDLVYLNAKLGTAINGYLSLSLSHDHVETNASLAMMAERRRRIKQDQENYDREHQQRVKERQARTALLEEQRKQAFEQERLSKEQLEQARVAAEQRAIAGLLDHLEILIYRRFNNILTYREATQLDNQVKNQAFKVAQRLRDSIQHNQCELRLQGLMADYEQGLNSLRQSPMAPLQGSLESMDPRVFEMHVCSVFQAEGFDAKLTPYVGDHGIDVVLQKSGRTYGVQCKRYRADRSIGSEEMQRFVGALATMRADGGFFIATGRFTQGALSIAAQNGVIACTSDNLARVLKALDSGPPRI